MKILDISSFYSESGGGVRTYHREKLAYFSRQSNHHYTMIVAGPRNEEEEIQGQRIYRVRGFPVSRGGTYRQLWDLGAIRRIVRREQPDVIETGSAYLDGWLGLLAGIDQKIATVGFYHADFPDSYMAPAVRGLPRKVSDPFVGFWRRYVRLAYRPFKSTLVTSKYIEKKLRSYGLDNVVRIPLGVDCERFNPARRDESLRLLLGISKKEKMLLYAGRFSPEKGIEPLAEALARLGKRPGTKICIIGAGPLEGLLRDKTEMLESVKLLEYEKDPDRIAALYASADIFLSPGPYETFGLAALEALASGTPVVAPASGGAGELVSESNGGLLFKPHDGEDLAACVERLLAFDVAAIGRRGRRYAEQKRTWNRAFARMTGCYEEIIDETRTRYSIAA